MRAVFRSVVATFDNSLSAIPALQRKMPSMRDVPTPIVVAVLPNPWARVSRKSPWVRLLTNRASPVLNGVWAPATSM